MHIFAKKLTFSPQKVADFCCYRLESTQSVPKLLRYIYTIISNIGMVYFFVLHTKIYLKVQKRQKLHIIAKNAKKTSPPHGLFCRWPMARRNEDHIYAKYVQMTYLTFHNQYIIHRVWYECSVLCQMCEKRCFSKKRPPPLSKPKTPGRQEKFEMI